MQVDLRILVLATILSFLIVIMAGPIIIPALKKFKFGQNIRQEGPQSHLKKAGTPTMGGIMFIISTLIATLVVTPSDKGHLWILLLTMLGYGLIGFLDDSLKIIKKQNLGLRAYQKIIGQFAFALILTLYAYYSPSIGSSIYIPFTNKMIDLGIFYIPFMIFVIIAVTNAVNLTDGLDGLCSGVTTIVMLFFTIAAVTTGSKDIAIFSGALVGGLLGFLKFNSYPAQTFMGDTGSLALGGAVSAIIIVMKNPLIVVLVGVIYVIEAFSVVIQVGYYKLTHKRVFLMAPIHHHFEQKGWHETKVTVWFCNITAIGCIISLLAICI